MFSLKKIFMVCCFVTLTMTTYAQYAPQLVTMQGSRVYIGEEKLSKVEAAALFSDAGGVDLSQDYLKYRAGYNTGVGLTIGGSVLFAGGTLTFVAGAANAFTGGLLAFYVGLADIMTGGDQISTTDEIDPYLNRANILINVGGYSILTGLVLCASGIPTLCVYKNRLGDLEYEYNKTVTSPIEVTVGGQNHGFGLAINF